MKMKDLLQKELGLAALTAVFLCALWWTFDRIAPQGAPDSYAITTQHYAPETEPEETGPLDINTATLEELDTLSGIGPVLAQRIIDYRDEHGPFQSVEELLEVKGIGEATLSRFREEITVKEEP